MKSRTKKAKKENSLPGEEGLDANSAFVHMAVKNRNSIPTTSNASSPTSALSYANGVGNGTQNGHQGINGLVPARSGLMTTGCSYHFFEQDMASLPEHSREAQKLAVKGNQLFLQKEYREASNYFTEAIKLDPQEVRFFGNRALCFEALGDFEKALEDADTAVSLQPQWPRGYYRRGCALEGMNRYEEAEKAFQASINNDTGEQFPEAVSGRQRVMIKQLTRLGFSEQQSMAAILHYSTVKQASDSLLATRLLSSSALTEIFDSDDEEALINDRRWSKRSGSSRSHSTNSGGGKSSTPPIQELKPNDPLTDPKNPLKWDTLWVGNLVPQTTEKMIHTMFNKFGKVRNSHMMLDKHCCFISYVDWKSAGEAMREVQGKDVHGQRILIKYPDRALTNGAGHKASFGTLVLKKSASMEHNEASTNQQQRNYLGKVRK